MERGCEGMLAAFESGTIVSTSKAITGVRRRTAHTMHSWPARGHCSNARPYIWTLFSEGWRWPVMVEKLRRDNIEVIALAVDDHHFHILARFADHNPRHWIGRVKMHASMLLSRHGLAGQVWATRCRFLPVNDRAHQLNVFHYISQHAECGAATWTFRDSVSVVSPRMEAR